MRKSLLKLSFSKLTAVLFAVMIAFVLCNAGAVYMLLARYQNALGQSQAISKMRTVSQSLAINAIRLSDGAFTQTSKLGHEMDTMESLLQLIKQGGVIDSNEISPIKYPSVAIKIPDVERNWSRFKGRLQNVLIDSYAGHTPANQEWQGMPDLIRRQWIADDSNALMVSLDSMSSELMPILYKDKKYLFLLSSTILVIDLFVLLFLYVIILRFWLRPLQHIRNIVSRFTQGEYKLRISNLGIGELRDIAKGFNSGIESIEKLLDSIRTDHAELKRSNSVFTGIAHNSIVGVFEANSDKFVFVSEKMADIFGYTPQEMLDKVPLLNIVVPRERFLLAESLKACEKRKDKSVKLQRQGRTKDGSIIDIEIFCTSLQADNKSSIVGLVQDITERKHTESSAQLAAIAYENSSEAIVITDPAGVVIDVNPAYSSMTGYWPDEVVGNLFALLQPSRDNQSFFDDMWHDINVNGRWEGE